MTELTDAECDAFRALPLDFNGMVRAIYAAGAARSADPSGARWQPIATAPMTGKKVILAYVNRNGKPRTVMARWLTDEQAAETDGDGVGLEGGWYECIDNWDDYTEVAIHEGDPSHWMPLPEPPPAAPGGPAEALGPDEQGEIRG